MVNKYLALKGEEKFDISKVTVVGSPTITEDGVASGFSSENYITIPAFVPENKAWKISLEFIPSETYGYLFSCGNIEGTNMLRGIRLLYSNTSLTLGLSYDGTSLSVSKVFNVSITTGIKHAVAVEYTGNQYNVYLDNVKLGEITSNTPIWNNINDKFYLGGWWNNGLTEIFTGSIDLNSFKIYVDNELVYSPTKPTYLLERRKPTVWNKGQFTIVGNPSISENGVASGFSVNNYVVTSKTIDFSNANSWEILTPVFRLNSMSTPNGIMTTTFDKDGIIDIFIRANGQVAWGVSDVFARRNPNANIKVNINYQLKIEFTSTNYNLYLSTNGGTFSLIDTYTSTQKTALNSTLITGMRWNSSLDGSINLKQFKIYTDNNLVFDGGAETYVYNASKFTIVGSPTITEYGVLHTENAEELQGVTIANSFNIDANSNFKVQMLCKVKNLSTINVWSSFLNFTKNAIYCATKNTMSLILYPNQFTLRLGSSSNSYLGAISIPHSTSGVTEDVFIPIEIIVNKNSYTLSVNGKSVSNTLEGMDVTDLICVLGNCGGANHPVPYGEIDLAQFLITVDGREVFTGAKEKFYALRM